MTTPVHYKEYGRSNNLACGIKPTINGNWFAVDHTYDPTDTTCKRCRKTEAHKKAMEARHD